jgi:hypothetical protein
MAGKAKDMASDMMGSNSNAGKKAEFQQHDEAMRDAFAKTALPGSERDHTTWATGAVQKGMKKGDNAGADKSRD